MIAVISQAWTLDEGEHAEAYMTLSEGFAAFFSDHPRYRGRLLVRGTEDRTHFTHIRFFDDLTAYDECTRREGYVAHTEAMYQHLAPYDSYPREIVEIAMADGALAAAFGL